MSCLLFFCGGSGRCGWNTWKWRLVTAYLGNGVSEALLSTFALSLVSQLDLRAEHSRAAVIAFNTGGVTLLTPSAMRRNGQCGPHSPPQIVRCRALQVAMADRDR